jgi:hypothetical protein
MVGGGVQSTCLFLFECISQVFSQSVLKLFLLKTQLELLEVGILLHYHRRRRRRRHRHHYHYLCHYHLDHRRHYLYPYLYQHYLKLNVTDM